LTRAAPGYYIYRRQFRSVQLGYIPQVEHLGKARRRYGDWERFYLTCPQRHYAVIHGGKREAAYAVEQTSEREHHLLTA